MPKHGEQIRRYKKTSYGPDQTLIDSITGKTVYHGPLCSSSQTMTVYHCDNCGEVELGFFDSIIFHDKCPHCEKAWKGEE